MIALVHENKQSYGLTNRYRVAAIQRHLDQLTKEELRTATLPTVIPLLFYRGGSSPYPYSTDVGDLFDEELGRQLWFSPIPLIDVTVIPDEALRTHRSIALLEIEPPRYFRRLQTLRAWRPGKH